MKQLKIFLLALLALLVSACAAPRASPGQEARIRNIAVVAIVPDKVHYVKSSRNPFTDSRFALIDMHGQARAAVLATAWKRLAKTRPQWHVKGASYDPRALYLGMHRNDGPLDFGEPIDRIRKPLAALAAANDVDALLVFDEAFYEVAGGDGIGITESELFTGTKFSLVQGNVHAFLVGRDGKVLASQGAGFGRKFYRIDVDRYGLDIPVTEDAARQVAPVIRDVLVENVEVRLEELGL
jgi:hypothetical protein